MVHETPKLAARLLTRYDVSYAVGEPTGAPVAVSANPLADIAKRTGGLAESARGERPMPEL